MDLPVCALAAMRTIPHEVIGMSIGCAATAAKRCCDGAVEAFRHFGGRDRLVLSVCEDEVKNVRCVLSQQIRGGIECLY